MSSRRPHRTTPTQPPLRRESSFVEDPVVVRRGRTFTQVSSRRTPHPQNDFDPSWGDEWSSEPEAAGSRKYPTSRNRGMDEDRDYYDRGGRDVFDYADEEQEEEEGRSGRPQRRLVVTATTPSRRGGRLRGDDDRRRGSDRSHSHYRRERRRWDGYDDDEEVEEEDGYRRPPVRRATSPVATRRNSSTTAGGRSRIPHEDNEEEHDEVRTMYVSDPDADESTQEQRAVVRELKRALLSLRETQRQTSELISLAKERARIRLVEEGNHQQQPITVHVMHHHISATNGGEELPEAFAAIEDAVADPPPPLDPRQRAALADPAFRRSLVVQGQQSHHTSRSPTRREEAPHRPPAAPPIPEPSVVYGAPVNHQHHHHPTTDHHHHHTSVERAAPLPPHQHYVTTNVPVYAGSAHYSAGVEQTPPVFARPVTPTSEIPTRHEYQTNHSERGAPEATEHHPATKTTMTRTEEAAPSSMRPRQGTVLVEAPPMEQPSSAPSSAPSLPPQRQPVRAHARTVVVNGQHQPQPQPHGSQQHADSTGNTPLQPAMQQQRTHSKTVVVTGGSGYPLRPHPTTAAATSRDTSPRARSSSATQPPPVAGRVPSLVAATATPYQNRPPPPTSRPRSDSEGGN